MTNSLRVVLLANGEMPDIEYVQSYLHKDDIVIAANGGTRLAFVLNRVPTLVVGDRDSLPPYLKEWLESHEVPNEKFSTDKDETDLELAIRYAIQLNPQKILFLGITGGRTDHMLANFSLLSEVAKHSIATEVIAKREHIYGVTDKIHLSGKQGDTVSLLPWGGDVNGVTTEGMKWELQSATLPFGPARGISNIMLHTEVTIMVRQGVLLVVHQKGEVL